MYHGATVSQVGSQRSRRQKWTSPEEEQEIIHRRNLVKLKRSVENQLAEKGEINYAVLNRPTAFSTQVKQNNERMNRQILTYLAPIGKR